MQSITVAPHFALDSDMYELARASLVRFAPEQVERFTWERFITRENWQLIPDVENPDVPFFKAEFIVKHGAPYLQTIKLNIWYSPDLRRDGAPAPHSHPWPFISHVLMGGYQETRYMVQYRNRLIVDPYTSWPLGQVCVEPNIPYQAEGYNNFPLHGFHEVTEVFEPGRTLTLMDCDLGRKEGWGYLNPDTGLYTPVQQSPIDPRFQALFLDRNPHLRK